MHAHVHTHIHTHTTQTRVWDKKGFERFIHHLICLVWLSLSIFAAPCSRLLAAAGSVLEVTAESMDSLPRHLLVLGLPAELRLPPRFGGMHFFYQREERSKIHRWDCKACCRETLGWNPLTVNRAEVAASSMSLSSVLSNSLLLSATHTRTCPHSSKFTHEFIHDHSFFSTLGWLITFFLLSLQLTRSFSFLLFLIFRFFFFTFGCLVYSCKKDQCLRAKTDKSDNHQWRGRWSYL